MITMYLKGRQNGGAKVILISLKFVISSISDNPTLFWTSIKIAELYNLYSRAISERVGKEKGGKI